MAISEGLYQELAKALARPSRAFRAAQVGLQIPEQAMEGYTQGADFIDKVRRRKQDQQTLAQVLGGTVSGLSPELQNLPFGRIKEVGSALGDLSKFGQEDNWLTKFNLQQDAIGKRQKDRQDFIKSMVGAKGNKDAVNQAKNAVQGLSYVDELWNQYDKMSEMQKAGAGTPILEKAFPSINTLKSNITRTAGFAEGGKALTGPERDIIVNSFLPTTYETPDSRRLKKQIAKDYYAGTIDLFQSAKLLGPAGSKIQAIAEAQRSREKIGNSLLSQEAGVNEDPFTAEGL